MHIFLFGLDAYAFFGGTVAVIATSLTCIFLSILKDNPLSVLSKKGVYYAMRKEPNFQKPTTIFLSIVEMALIAFAYLSIATSINRPLGNLLGTGGNYFGGLFLAPVLWLIICCIFMVDPLKKIDIATIFMPVCLVFVKIGCYCAGCCAGILWEHGPYNHKPQNPGNQVPVQLIEAFWALLIFVFLLWYRKRAKKGTMYPMYMILYSATRFCSEFLRHEENVFGILKTYHILCLIGLVVGIIYFFIAVKFGDKISDFFDKKHEKIDAKIKEIEDAEALKIAEEKAAVEAERLEKVRLAREKAKARRKK